MGKYLVGRIIYFKFYPLSFSEYLEAVDKNCYEFLKDSLARKDGNGSMISQLRHYFDAFLVYGGYPRVVESLSDREK